MPAPARRLIPRRALAALAGALLLVAPLHAAAAPPCAFATLDEAEAMAERAAALLERAGPEQALPAFMDPGGAFVDRDLYVFVFDLDGVLWANGGFPDLVGSDARMARSSDGRLFVQEMIRTALERGQGWVEYEWYNPCTRKLSHKVSFFKRVGSLIVGVGAYGTLTT